LERYEGAPVDAIRQASRRALENLVALAIEEHVAFVIIAGDLFDGDWKDYNTGLYFVKQMTRLNEAGIAVFLLKGNHDAANKLTKSLPLPPNVRVFRTKRLKNITLEDLNVSVHGQSFATGDVRDDLSSNYPAAQTGKFQQSEFCHTCGPQVVMDMTLMLPAKSMDSSAKVIITGRWGHIHKREVPSTKIHSSYSLAIFREGIFEKPGPKGCSLVSVDGPAFSFIFLQLTEEFCELSVLRWELLSIQLSDSKTEEEAFAVIAAAISACISAADAMPLALRIHLEGRHPLIPIFVQTANTGLNLSALWECNEVPTLSGLRK